MYGRKVKLRLLFVFIILITLILSVFLVLKSVIINLTSLEFIEIEFFLTIPPTLILLLSISESDFI